MELAVKVFLKRNDEYIFGPGRKELLKAVDELGSLQKAAQSLKMSYRWAWGRLKKSENFLGLVLLTRTKKPISGRPSVLTEEGRALLKWYEVIEDEMEKAIKRAEKKRPDILKNLSSPLKIDSSYNNVV